jgi:hypothetical protein
MPVTFQSSKDEIRLTVFGAICQDISEWQTALDEMVFNEQLATGSFRGRYHVEGDLLRAMQVAKTQGRIMPYYGAGGSRGSCVYRLQRTDGGYMVQVENTTVHKKSEFYDELGLPAMSDQPPTSSYTFKIDGKELRNLRAWEQWDEAQAGTARYQYEFGEVSLGRLGYTVRVWDRQTGERLDATDYQG